MKSIVVVDKNWGIGRDNGLLIHLPGDLKYFKETTLGKIIIMGRKTLESLPGKRPLPGRTTIVFTSQEDYEPAALPKEGRLLICNSFDELMTLLLTMEYSEGIDIEEDVFVAGGESIYRIFTPYCREFLVTKIDEVFEADKYFQNLDEAVEMGQMSLTWESEPVTENGVSYKFTKYAR